MEETAISLGFSSRREIRFTLLLRKSITIGQMPKALVAKLHRCNEPLFARSKPGSMRIVGRWAGSRPRMRTCRCVLLPRGLARSCRTRMSRICRVAAFWSLVFQASVGTLQFQASETRGSAKTSGPDFSWALRPVKLRSSNPHRSRKTFSSAGPLSDGPEGFSKFDPAV
jgi:hypothetical protein